MSPRFIHILTNGRISSLSLFLRLDNIPLYMYTAFYFFICWWTLRLFWYVGFCESCNERWECRYLVSFTLDIYLEVGLLDLTVVLFLIFWGNFILFFMMVITKMNKGFLFSTLLTTLVIFNFFIVAINRNKVDSYYDFDLYFLDH